MTRSVYHVVRHQRRWHVKFRGKYHGPYDTRSEAIRSAIDVAYIDGKSGKDAVVTIEADDDHIQIIWTYGVDPYPPAP